MRLYSFVAAAALASASLAAHADVMYTYVGGGQSAGTTFTIDSPDFLTYSGTYIPVATSAGAFRNGQSEGVIESVAFFQGSFQGLGSQSTGAFSLFAGSAGSYTINQDGFYT